MKNLKVLYLDSFNFHKKSPNLACRLVYRLRTEFEWSIDVLVQSVLAEGAAGDLSFCAAQALPSGRNIHPSLSARQGVFMSVRLPASRREGMLGGGSERAGVRKESRAGSGGMAFLLDAGSGGQSQPGLSARRWFNCGGMRGMPPPSLLKPDNTALRRRPEQGRCDQKGKLASLSARACAPGACGSGGRSCGCRWGRLRPRGGTARS